MRRFSPAPAPDSPTRTAALAFALALLAGTAACTLGDEPPTGGDTNDPACQIQATQEHGPGWPFDLGVYETQIVPVLVKDCSAAGCHGAPQGQGNYTVWADTAVGNCSFAKTFNQLAAKIDLANPTASPIVSAINGTLATHPYRNEQTAQLFLNYASAAATQAAQDTAPPGASPFDYTVYQTAIQPILDNAEGIGCAGSSCHGSPLGAAGFKLFPVPAQGSAEMEANFLAVTSRISLETPDTSVFVQRGTVRHGGGASALFSASDLGAINSWITVAQQNAPPGGGGGGQNCPSIANFNLDVFRDEIQPVLFGQIGTSTGCSLGACHGVDRSGGALVLKETNTPEQNLKNFVCFVDIAHPVASEILACPLDQAPCRRRPHPGQDVFTGAEDPNFQRVLSFLYGAKTTAAPLDFAFYVRAINPIFNDINAVQGGAQNRTCADAACHGVSAAGQFAPNGSNFPIIANLSDPGSLKFNFSSAANFTNFLTPDGSSLFLYPTNQIANLENPFATGLAHPGGEDFAVDSAEALAILRWARGLRPDNAGFITDWLVAGDYSAALITSPTVIDEKNAKPAIFDPSGSAQFNQGQWDALISPQRDIDLGLEFPRAATAGRVAYAVVYVLNTSPSDIDALVTVRSPNEVRVYVDEAPVLQAADADAGATALATFPAFGSSKKSTRLLIKVFQRAGDADFEFSVQLSDQNGNPLSDASGELVIKLGPDGGI